jgi:3-dehydroquinate synthase
MTRKTENTFSGKIVETLYDASFAEITSYAAPEHAVIITDHNVAAAHEDKFRDYRVIKLMPGEAHKTQQTVDAIVQELLDMDVDKNTLIIGVGGGVVTDIAGYVASIYKRGTRLGLVPTSILGMVDAAIGGKNGVDVGPYKNMVGTVYQPEFILYDYSFLESLPVKEWTNGFAEIIKHACIRDRLLLSMLEKYDMHQIQSDITLVAELVERNAAIKMEIVVADEFEKADRKLLNFGHTIGHAIENLHHLPHGHAVSIGMVAACNLSEKMNGLHFKDAERVVKLLARYHLPVDIETDHARVFEVLRKDKKREHNDMHFVLLNKIGDAEAKKVPMQYLQDNLKSIL